MTKTSGADTSIGDAPKGPADQRTDRDLLKLT